MVAGQTVRLLVITEDSAQEAFTALSWLVKKAARLLEPHTQTQHLQLSPLTGNQGAKLAAMAMGWKSQQPADDNKRRDLVRTITTALLSETWVIFHYDADVDWKDTTKASTGSGSPGRCGPISSAPSVPKSYPKPRCKRG